MVRYVHANALVFDGKGIFIRGASKSGKSSLTLALIAAAERSGVRASLVGDDRIGLRAEQGDVFASPHPRIAGMIEVRGAGIQHRPFIKDVQILLVVDLVESFATPGKSYDDAGFVTLEGVELRHLRLSARHDSEKMLQCITRVLK